MFRIESYLTSIILSYVDRYIKNFRRQDAQVSLWEGDGLFQNLNLDLEVLEQELNLPFSFVSGHIHELLIHVPWTRIASEPVRITINTIECVMKLRTPGSYHTSPSDAKQRRLNQQISGDDSVAPPSYISSLVNKIICNLSITCNNLILKYVEEDIVLSMNIKTLSLGTVNANWEPEFSELSSSQLTLRKLISLADVTICLDKRNASGRIESYLEPLLYRCFMTLRLSRIYPSVNASRASSTRLDILCEQMAFTLSEPQIPMLMRLIALGLALNRKQFTSQVVDNSLNEEGTDGSETDNMSNEGVNVGESWATWAFSWMPAILPLVIEDESNPYDPAFLQIDHTLKLGVYINVFTLAFKLCETDTGVVSGGKGQTQPFLHITLFGSRMDIMSHGQGWVNVQMGVSQASVQPDGDCCCGAVEPSNQLPYLTSGSVQETPVAPVNTEKDSSAEECTWDYHLATVTETLLLEKTPAFAIDYLFCLERLENEEYENEDEDAESILKKERVLLRYVAGPVVIRVCSGFIHRIQMLLKAASNYDYPPYVNASSVPATDPKTVEAVSRLISEGTVIDEEVANCYFPVYISQFTAFNTTVEFYPANHLPVQQGVLGRKLSRLQKRAQNSLPVPNSPPPSVIVEWKCIYAKLTRPMNAEKLVAVSTIFEQNKLPSEMIRAAETRLAFKVVGVRSSVRIPEAQPMALLEMNSLAFEQTFHNLLTHSEKDITSDFRIHIGSATVTSTKAKLVLLTEIICSLFATNNRIWHQSCYNMIYNTTLLQDAAATTEIICLKLNADELILRRVVTAVSNTIHMSVGASQAFIVKVLDRERILDTMILAAPDTDSSATGHLFELIFQHPLGECIYLPFLSFKLCEMRVSLDPLFYTWLLYTPKPSGTGQQPLPALKSWTSVESNKTRRASESSMGSHVRRAPTPQESVHSSSERETTPSGHVSSQPILESVHSAPAPPFSERVCMWYPVWKSIIVCGDVSQLRIYSPNYSLVRAEPQSMESSLQSGLKQTSQHLQVVVVKMPTISLRCAASKQNLSELPLTIPVVLPDHMWSKDKSNFPWTLNISDLHCYTLHGGTCLQLLKPVSLNCTIGTSPKFSSGNMTSLALCMYLDTTPVAVSLSEEQVALLTLLAMSQLQLFQFYFSAWLNSGNSTHDDTQSSVKLVSSDESLTLSQPDDNCEGLSGSKVKLSGWLQWTLARFTLTVYNQPKISRSENLKLTLDIEDVILSLDVERVYHKVKLKVASASVKHYTRPSIKHIWKLGAFKGLVMRGYDPEGLGISNTVKHSTEDTPAPSGFLTATLTRAQCNNLHSRLGSPSKAGSLTKKTQGSDTENRFITEIVVKLQPLDFVVSPSTLATFVHVLDPLVRVSSMKESVSKQPEIQPTMLNSSSLPLVYLELMAIRIMLPVLYKTKNKNEHDVLILQLDSVVISPQPENPICRTPLRPDIYHAAEKHRILNIPGSEVEDRQYQLDLVSVKLNTGVWYELEEVLSQEVSVSPVQNPALDWNEGRQPHSNPPTPQMISTVISSFNVCVVTAPAILYRNKVVVCGHSAEINAVSEINVTLTLSQLHLCLLLLKEGKMLLASTLNEDVHTSRGGHSTNIATVGSTILHSDYCDSGFESVNSSVNILYKRDDANMAGVHTAPSSSLSQVSGHAHSSVPSPLVSHTYLLSSKKGCVVPLEILITGSVIFVAAFHVDDNNIKEAVPLLYVRISQPHTFFSKNADTTVTQISVFDMSIRCGMEKHTVSTTQLSARSFPQLLMETKNGEAHPITGIPPSLLTTKCTFSPCKLPKIEVDVERPVRVICSVDIIEFLSQIKYLIFTAVADCYDSSMPQENVIECQDALTERVSSKHGAHAYSALTHFSNISINTKQLVLSAMIKETSDGEMSISLGTFSGCVSSTMTLQQSVSVSLRFNNFTVSTRTCHNQLRLLLHPWTFRVDVIMSWDSWIALSDPPLLHISVESDILAVDISPHQLEYLTNLRTEYSKYLIRDNNVEAVKEIIPRKSSADSSTSEEQHYKDDLQAGAFQFVDSIGGREDLPLTYQVAFWSGQVPIAPTMAWKYPQPRALTKLYLMPIPFKEGSMRTKLKCMLQYYSESHSSYRDYLTFELSESEPCSVDLPSTLPSQAVATTWRVVLGIDSASEPAPVLIKALAASLRVDSFFSPVLVPSLQVAVKMTSIQALFWVHTNNQRPLPEPFTRFTSENSLPQDHCFLTASVEQCNMSLTLWNKKLYSFSINGRPRLDILNYMTLSNQCCISPFLVVINLYRPTASFPPRYSIVTGPVGVRFGPAVCHTLAACVRIWLQYSTSKPRYQIVLTPYVICNNTCLSIRMGQAHTDEVIPLHCLQCHLYSWRSTRAPLSLRLSLLESDEISWSKGLELHTEGTKLVLVTDPQKKKWPLFVTVKKISSAVSQVIICGQLTIYNSLSAPLEVRIIPDDSTQRQSSLMVPNNAVPPSVALNVAQQVSLRVRFSIFAGLWSGLIPLRRDGSVTKHWLVKVPLKNKGQYRSVWCQIVWSYTDDIQRTLIVISPMYTICSHLACEANVQIETPDLNSSKSVILLGRGNIQDLDCPGLSEHIHNLTFQLDGQVQASRPIVPLSYPLLEGKLEAPKPCNLNMDSLLDKLNHNKTVNFWPFIGTEWKGFEWAESTQPDTVTHVKVKITEDCIQGRSLLVELRPWALLINTVGCHVYVHNNDIVLCSLPHCSIICPPSLESTFQLGVDAHGMRYLSDSLQLSTDRAFYIPRIAGLIPPNGFISTIINCDSSVIYTNITSCEVEGMRLICMRSMYMIANLTTFELKITPIVVKASKEQQKHDIPLHLLETSSFVLTNQKPSSDLKCNPITEWHTVGTGSLELIPYLVIRVGDICSCPVSVKENSDRQVSPVLFPANKPGQSPIQLRLTFQQREGQTYLLLWEHPYPQITLHNNTKKTILFAKSKKESGGTPEYDTEDWNWHMRVPPGCTVHYHLQVKNPAGSEPSVFLPSAVIAIIPSFPLSDSQVLQWSDAISLTPCNGRLLTLSGLPDLCMSVVKQGFTVHIVLMHASHTEILAVDIRGQLSKEYMQREERLLDDMDRKTLQLQEVPQVHETGNNGKSADQHSPPSSCGGSVYNTTGRETERQAEITCYMKSFSVTLLGQSNSGCDCQEIAAATLDSIGITLLPQFHQETEVKEVRISVSINDIQLDNQEYHIGGYDFPVVLMKQSATDFDEVISKFDISEDAEELVKASRNAGTLLEIDITLDLNSHQYTSVQDVSVKLQPLQVYIEDTYLLHLKDCLTNVIPAFLLSEVPSKQKYPVLQNSIACVQSEVNKEPTGCEAEGAKSVKEYKKNEITNYNADSASQNNDNRKQANEDQEEDLFNVSESDEENHNTTFEEASINEKHHAHKSVQEFDLLKQKDTTFESEVLWNIPSITGEDNEAKEPLVGTAGLPVPADILTASQELAQPLRLRSLSISDIHLLVSVHTSTRFYIALDHSPLHLSAFKRLSLETTPYRMGHALTLHYFLGAIYGTGWAISSLELLGAPGGLARTLGSGLRDFVSLPYRGILLGPRAFLVGIAHGSASLMKHITAGTLTSVTKLAASWARTLDRLTLDRTDLQHTEQLRRMRPHGLTQGFVQGLTEFGISLLGAISSIAHHPLQYVMSNEPDRSLVNSIGLGLVGVITRPLSGAAELVALTGEGLLSGAGWSNAPRARHQPVTKHSQCGSDSLLKYSWKFLFPCELLLYITEATNDTYEAVTLLITNNTMYVVNTDLDVVVQAITLTELSASANRSDPTLIAFHIRSPDAEVEALAHHRVAEFVRESQCVLIGDQSCFGSQSTPVVTEVSQPSLQFYINPQVREHFLAVLKFAKQHAHSKGFPVIT